VQIQEASASAKAAPQHAGRASVGLVSLYAWATRLMPKNGHYNDETYIRIWINYARHQWCDTTAVHTRAHVFVIPGVDSVGTKHRRCRSLISLLGRKVTLAWLSYLSVTLLGFCPGALCCPV